MISPYKMNFYPQPDSYSRNKIKIELELSNYATKSDLKWETDINASEFAKKADLASLKSKINKIDIDELETVLTNLRKLSNLVKHDFVKGTTSGELVKNFDTIDLNKQNLDNKIEDVDKKIPNTSKFIVTQDLNRLTKVNFDGRMAVALRILATKKQVENAIDLGSNV